MCNAIDQSMHNCKCTALKRERAGLHRRSLCRAIVASAPAWTDTPGPAPCPSRAALRYFAGPGARWPDRPLPTATGDRDVTELCWGMGTTCCTVHDIGNTMFLSPSRSLAGTREVHEQRWIRLSNDQSVSLALALALLADLGETIWHMRAQHTAQHALV